KKEYEDFIQEVDGHYYGIGVEIKSIGGRIIVVSPIEGSPAAKAGLKPGDEIIRVNGESIEGNNILDAVKKIRGSKGTSVNLEISRKLADGSDFQILNFTVLRDEISLQPVKGVKLPDNVLYIRVSKFLTGTAEAIKDILREHRNEKIYGIILDVRLNPGGLLKEVLQTVDLFLDKGLILETRSRHKSQQKKYYATDRIIIKPVPCVILIDKGSASASEILAGALKENGYALLVGEKTFGKGSVQTSFELPSGDALVLTTAEYYTKSGLKIDGNGIEPTFEVKNPEAKYVFSQDWHLDASKFLNADDPVFNFALQKIKEMIEYTHIDHPSVVEN
ncbi:MAG: S41 family peptidase, partial [Deltaproteobacteria bacterium]|nr:S41 family peptidase [Deltaproteobacteria bacterium]